MASAGRPFDDNGERTVRRLRRNLSIAAGRATRRATLHLAADEWELFYINAGAAVELATKAALARVDPLLLLPASAGNRWNSFAKQLLEGAVSVDESIQTVGAVEAVKRLLVILPSIADPRLPDWARSIFTPRNALVHMGEIHPPVHPSHNEAARAYFHALLHLHELADLDGKHTHPHYELFGHYAQFARESVAAVEDERRLRVGRLLASAQARLDRLGAEQRVALTAVATRAERNGRDEPDRVYLTCPVCGAPAEGIGRLSDDGDAEAEPADGEIMWTWAPEFNVWIETLYCEVCTLHLDAADLEIAGLPTFAPHPADAGALSDYYYHSSNDD